MLYSKRCVCGGVYHIHNGILLSREKEWNNAICSSMDGPRDCHTKWSKSARGRQILYDLTYTWNLKNSTVQSLSLRPHGLQPSRLPCWSSTPGAYSNSCPLSRWCHPTISSSVVPFSSCLQSFPASESFPVSQSFASVQKYSTNELIYERKTDSQT